jgi:muramoyltetrapeptide carboxypeptidase
MEMITPRGLRPGDKIAIVAPASKINPDLIDAAAAQLTREGFRVEVMPHAKGTFGSYSGTADERLADLHTALTDPEVACVLCARGGYGAVHLLPQLDTIPAHCFNKWLVGFSDITALHSLWQRKGVASLHGAMTKHLGCGTDFACYNSELAILCGASPDCHFPAHPFNRPGTATGMLVGGNMAVMGGLIGTPFDPILPGSVLFIEDIAEPIYKIERLLWQLKLKGTFDNLAALLVGQFTDYKPSADHTDMYSMIRSMVADYHFPVAFNLPVGHIEQNHPLLLNHPVTATITPTSLTLSY